MQGRLYGNKHTEPEKGLLFSYPPRPRSAKMSPACCGSCETSLSMTTDGGFHSQKTQEVNS